jgi:hypothetical protein
MKNMALSLQQGKAMLHTNCLFACARLLSAIVHCVYVHQVSRGDRQLGSLTFIQHLRGVCVNGIS